VPDFIEIEETFSWTDGRTPGRRDRLWDPPY